MVSEARLLAVVAAARVARRVKPGGVVPRRCTRLGSLPKGEGVGGVDPRCGSAVLKKEGGRMCMVWLQLRMLSTAGAGSYINIIGGLKFRKMC